MKQIDPEMFRYYLMSENCIDHDANISLMHLKDTINSQLADNYGNLVLRCTNKKIIRYYTKDHWNDSIHLSKEVQSHYMELIKKVLCSYLVFVRGNEGIDIILMLFMMVLN